jgi:hypothetical protein
MEISRQAYYKRIRAYEARAQHDQGVLDFVLEIQNARCGAPGDLRVKQV